MAVYFLNNKVIPKCLLVFWAKDRLGVFLRHINTGELAYPFQYVAGDAPRKALEIRDAAVSK